MKSGTTPACLKVASESLKLALAHEAVHLPGRNKQGQTNKCKIQAMAHSVGASTQRSMFLWQNIGFIHV